MEKPKLTWYSKVHEDTTYDYGKTLYAGSYTNSPLVVDIQLWNNRYGTANVEDLSNFRIVCFFKHYEDSVLLNGITAVLNKTTTITPVIANDKAIINLPDSTVISGLKNDGTTYGSKKNYLDLQIRFEANGKTLKDDDLKSLYLKVIQD